MAKKTKKTTLKKKLEACGPGTMGKCKKTDSTCAVYGLGFLGAAIYYISQSAGFWGGVLGFLKALIWPAFLVYELLKFLGM